MIEIHVCAVCGRPAESGPRPVEGRYLTKAERLALGTAGRSHGALVLFEVEGGGEAWMHHVCAERAQAAA